MSSADTLTNLIRCKNFVRGCMWHVLFQPGDSAEAEWSRDVHEIVCLHSR